MRTNLYVPRTPVIAQRQVEGEGILRMLLLCTALAMPMGSMAYLKIQQTRMSYQMSEIRDQMHREEESRRGLLLERSKYQRDEEVQAFADRSGLMPRKQSHLINKVFTKEDQRLAKLLPQGGVQGL
jgi:uncharacterized protein HemX